MPRISADSRYLTPILLRDLVRSDIVAGQKDPRPSALPRIDPSKETAGHPSCRRLVVIKGM